MPDTDGRDDHREWSRLMAAAQDGDRAAYERLLREITPLLRRVAARRLYQVAAADVEDVVQDFSCPSTPFAIRTIRAGPSCLG